MGLRVLGVCGVVSLVFGISAFAGTSEPVTHQGKVNQIIDGDTIRFLDAADGKTILKVRMAGIDAPEEHLVLPGGQMVGQPPFGKMAHDELATLVPSKASAELLDFGTDKYGRTLGRLLIKGKDINLEMVKNGMAVPYLYCVAEDCDATYFQRTDAAAYVAACESAQAQGLGIFNPKKQLTEMPYNFRRRMNNHTATSLTGDFRTKKLYSAEDGEKVPVCERIFFTSADDAAKVGYTQ